MYIADTAKLITETAWTDWTAGARWTLGDTAIHTGVSSDVTYTAGITNATNYTFDFQITGIGTASTLKLTCGTYEGSIISTSGWHTQSFVSNGTTLTITCVGDVTIHEFNILSDVSVTSGTQRFELPAEWSHLLAIYATYSGLLKDKRIEQAVLLSSLYYNEFNYLSQNIIEVIPDSKNSLVW
jgi:hypothetical protein